MAHSENIPTLFKSPSHIPTLSEICLGLIDNMFSRIVFIYFSIRPNILKEWECGNVICIVVTIKYNYFNFIKKEAMVMADKF